MASDVPDTRGAHCEVEEPLSLGGHLTKIEREAAVVWPLLDCVDCVQEDGDVSNADESPTDSAQDEAGYKGYG